MKAAVFTHGRGMFVFTAGRLCSHRSEYDITAGSGNGAILATFAACGKYDMLHDFINFTKKGMFYERRPFHTQSSSIFSLITSYFKRKTVQRNVSRTLIPYFEKELAPLYYDMMINSKQMHLSIYNSIKQNVEIKKIPHGIAYDRFAKYLKASISHPLFYSGTKIGDSIYRSAATIEPLPLMKLMDLGAKEIDIYANLPMGCLDGDPNETPFYSFQLLDENSRYLQLKEIRQFLFRFADDKGVRFRIFLMPIQLFDVDEFNIDTYFDRGYIASDLLNVYKG